MWLNIEEEKSKDTETKHGAETVGYLAHRHGDLTGESWDPASSGWITPIGNLNRPTDVRVTAEGNSLWVRWQDNAEGESGYVVETSADGGATWQTAASLVADSVQTTIGGLETNTPYQVRVAATNALGGATGFIKAVGQFITGLENTSGVYGVSLGAAREGYAEFAPAPLDSQGRPWDQLALRGAARDGTAFVTAGSWEEAVRKTVYGGLNVEITFGNRAEEIEFYRFGPEEIADLSKFDYADEGYLVRNNVLDNGFPGVPLGKPVIVLEDQHKLDQDQYPSDTDWNDFGAQLMVERVAIDLAIDSNNDGSIDQVDDSIEDDATLPGALILANVDDGDLDGIPDYADGFDLWNDVVSEESVPPSRLQGEQFVPLDLTIPEPIDLSDESEVRFRLDYNEARPVYLKNHRSGSGTTEDPFKFGWFGAGPLRIWFDQLQSFGVDGYIAQREDGGYDDPAEEIRNGRDFWRFDGDNDGVPDGDFVSPWVAPADDPTNLGWGIDELHLLGFRENQRTITLFVEASNNGLHNSFGDIDSAATLGGERIIFQLDPDGDGPASAVEDAVRLTPIEVAVVLDDQGDRTIDHLDPVAPFLQIGHWGEDVGGHNVLPGGPPNGLNGTYFFSDSDVPVGLPAQMFNMFNPSNFFLPSSDTRNDVGTPVNNWNSFIDRDPDRFYVRVVDPTKNASPTEVDVISSDTVSIGTIMPPFLSSSKSDTRDPAHPIWLVETGPNTGVFVSESQLLTTMDIGLPDRAGEDDGLPVATAHGSGKPTDEMENDRTRQASIDDAVQLIYGPFSTYVPVSQRGSWQIGEEYFSQDSRREVLLKAHVVDEPFTDSNGNGMYDIGEPFDDRSNDLIWNTVHGSLEQAQAVVDGEIARANVAMAQAGIKVSQVDSLQRVSGSHLADGLEEGHESAALIQADIDTNPSLWRVYFTGPLDQAAGWTFSTETTGRQRTYSFVGMDMSASGKFVPYEAGRRILAHELGHSLDNASNDPDYLYGTRGVFYPYDNAYLDDTTGSFRRITHRTEDAIRTIRSFGDPPDTAGSVLLHRSPLL